MRQSIEKESSYFDAVIGLERILPKGMTAPGQADYQQGLEYFNNRQYGQAVKYYQLATGQGNADAQYNLARCYYNGQGVLKDLSLAVNYCQLAAKQGNADAQYSLGGCYRYGQGVSKDSSQAVKYYQLAANQGYADAQNNLGFCYQNGLRVIKDLSQAVKYYQLVILIPFSGHIEEKQRL